MDYDIVAFVAPLSAIVALGLSAAYDNAVDLLFFDRRFHVDTSGSGPPTRGGDGRTGAGEHYVPTPIRTMRSILAALPIDHREFAFIDFGSGKGRTLLVAAEFEFRRIIGIECSPDLVAIARTNLDHYGNPNLRHGTVETVCMDAARFTLPDGPLALYFFNPFPPPVMERVAENLRRALRDASRPVLIIYYHPQYHGWIRGLPDFRRLPVVGANTDYFEVFGNAAAADFAR